MCSDACKQKNRQTELSDAEWAVWSHEVLKPDFLGTLS
jgi:hypothetical protein